MLFFGSQVIAVILAVLLHHGNGRGASPNKVSDSVILPMEANPVWRHKRSLADEPECYSGDHTMVHLPHTGLTITYPVCMKVARFTACSSSMANNNNKRKCVPSNYVGYPKDHVAYPTKCSCAPWNECIMVVNCHWLAKQGYVNYWPAKNFYLFIIVAV